MSIHNNISQINLSPRSTAAEYQTLYSSTRDLAKSQDNREQDNAFRGGEVWIRSVENQEFVSLAFQRDEGYVGEHLSVYQTQLTDEGKHGYTTGLRAEPTDKSERYLRFHHLINSDGKLGYEHEEVVLVDTQTGTLFQETR
jgi:hypothetical protein